MTSEYGERELHLPELFLHKNSNELSPHSKGIPIHTQHTPHQLTPKLTTCFMKFQLRYNNDINKSASTRSIDEEQI